MFKQSNSPMRPLDALHFCDYCLLLILNYHCFQQAFLLAQVKILEWYKIYTRLEVMCKSQVHFYFRIKWDYLHWTHHSCHRAGLSIFFFSISSRQLRVHTRGAVKTNSLQQQDAHTTGLDYTTKAQWPICIMMMKTRHLVQIAQWLKR